CGMRTAKPTRSSPRLRRSRFSLPALRSDGRAIGRATAWQRDSRDGMVIRTRRRRSMQRSKPRRDIGWFDVRSRSRRSAPSWPLPALAVGPVWAAAVAIVVVWPRRRRRPRLRAAGALFPPPWFTVDGFGVFLWASILSLPFAFMGELAGEGRIPAVVGWPLYFC